MILEVCWDGLRTLSFKLSQVHGHGSWLVCEVALTCFGDGMDICIYLEHDIAFFLVVVVVWYHLVAHEKMK